MPTWSGAATWAMASKMAAGWTLPSGSDLPRLGRRARPLALLAPHHFRPAMVDTRLAVARRLDHGAKRQPRGRQHLRLPPPVVHQLAGIVRDPHEARVREHGRRAVAELVVELAADDEDQVGLRHRRGPDGARKGRVVGRDQPPALLRVEVEGARGVQQAHQLLRRTPRTPAGDDQRAPRRPQRLDRGRDRVRVRGDLARALGLQPLVQHQRVRHRHAQHVGRDLDEDRPRLAQVPGRPRHRLVQLAQHLVGHAQGARGAGHRAQDVDVRDVLERPHVDLRPRRAAADHQHRRPCQRRVRDRRHHVGDARAGRHHRHAQAARQLGVGVRHVDRRPLVPHVDDADAEPGAVVPDRLDVAALEAEDAVDPPRLEELRDPGRAGLRVGVEVHRLAHRSAPLSAREPFLQDPVQDLPRRRPRHLVLSART